MWRARKTVIFVTAYDEYAVKAFEMNAVDYLTKPVGEARLREALRRVRDRLERQDFQDSAARHLQRAVSNYERFTPVQRLDRIPVRQKQEIVLVPYSRLFR